MNARPFVPDEFAVPAEARLGDYSLRALTPADLEPDYEAVMESAADLHAVFSRGHAWPAEDMPKAQDLADLEMHAREWAGRVGFAYVIRRADDDAYLGCLYLYPTRKDYDVQAYFWLRTRERNAALEETLMSAIDTWLRTAWPFARIAFPGRRIGWDAWEAMPPTERAPVVG